MHQLPGFVALFVLVTSVAFAQSTADTAVALENTPIYVVADASRTPLRVAAQGTVFRVLQEDGDWTRVQFTDGGSVTLLNLVGISMADDLLTPDWMG